VLWWGRDSHERRCCNGGRVVRRGVVVTWVELWLGRGCHERRGSDKDHFFFCVYSEAGLHSGLRCPKSWSSNPNLFETQLILNTNILDYGYGVECVLGGLDGVCTESFSIIDRGGTLWIFLTFTNLKRKKNVDCKNPIGYGTHSGSWSTMAGSCLGEGV